MGPEPEHYDVAYGAFLFSGVVSLLTVGISALPLGTGTAGGIGILIVLPAYVLSLMAMVVGIGVAVWIRGDKRLWGLAGLALLMLANFFLEFVPGAYSSAVPTLYGASAVVVGGLWFARERRR